MTPRFPDKTKLIGRDLVVTTLGALRASDVVRYLSAEAQAGSTGKHLILRDAHGNVAYTSRRLTPAALYDLALKGSLDAAHFATEGYLFPHPTTLRLVLPGAHRVYRGEDVLAALLDPESGFRYNYWRNGRRTDRSRISEVYRADFSVVHADRLEITFLPGPIVFTQQMEECEEAVSQAGPTSLLMGCKAVLQSTPLGNDVLRYLNPGAQPSGCEDATHEVGLCGCFANGPGLALASRVASVQVITKLPLDRR